MTQSPEDFAEPVIRDKRKIDPETLQARPAGDESPAAAAAAGEPAGPSEADPAAETPAPGLADLKAENAKLADDLARANASLFNVSQEYSGFVRRSKEAAVAARSEGREDVALALLSVLDDIHLAREHGDLEDGPFRSVAEKLENALATNFGVARFGAIGEEFDPTLHEALADQPSPAATSTTISVVVQPGYRLREKVLRAARVVVTSPAG